MSNAVNQPLSQLNPSPPYLDRALFLGKVLISIEVLAAILLTYLTFRWPAWQLYPVIVVAFGMAGLTAFAGWLIRKERLQLGIKLTVGATLSFILVTAILIADLSLLFGLAGIILTLDLVAQTLPRREALGATILAGGVTMVALLLDAWDPAFRTVLPLPAVALPIAALVVAIAMGALSVLDFFDRPLWVKFVILFLALTMIPLGGLTYVNGSVARQALVTSAQRNLQTATYQTVQTLEAFFQKNLIGVGEDARLPQLAAYLRLSENERSFSVEAQETWLILQSLSRVDRTYLLSYAILDQQGRTLIDTNTAGRSLNRFSPDYFEALKSGPHVSPVISTGNENLFTIHFSSPIRDSDGQALGVLIMHYDAQILQKFISEQTGLGGAQSYAILLDEYHIRLADGGNPDRRFTALSPLSQEDMTTLQAERRLPAWSLDIQATDQYEFDQELDRLPGSGFFTFADVPAAQDRTGVKMAAAGWRFVPQATQDGTWYVVMAQPETTILAPARIQQRNTLLLTAAVVGLAIAAALLLANRLANPLVKLAQLATKAASGNLKDRLPVETDDEVGILVGSYNHLADQVAQRFDTLTEVITTRSGELAFSVMVGKQASSTRDLNELVSTVITMIRDHFNLYHVQLFFMDDTQRNLVLSAATGEIGQQMLDRGFRLPLPHNSVIGWVVQQHEALVLPDVSKSSLYNPIPLLGRTRSELAVPLIVEGTVIGVLDMHSAREETFTEDSRMVFEAIGIQLTGAIDTARQVHLVRETQHRLEEAARLFAKESWSDRLKMRRIGETLGFTYNLSVVSPLSNGPANPDRQDGRSMSAPLLVQNETIGELSVNAPPDRKWGQDEQLLLGAVARQLAQKAENLRLFDNARERATREQIVRQITDRIRASSDIEMALKSTAQELVRALRSGRAVVDLRVDRIPEERAVPINGTTISDEPES